jgi:hypothetical protein
MTKLLLGDAEGVASYVTVKVPVCEAKGVFTMGPPRLTVRV